LRPVTEHNQQCFVFTIHRPDISPTPKLHIHVPEHGGREIMVAASPNVFSQDWTTYNVIDGDKNLGVCRIVEMGVSRWSTRLFM
jgi:hypothetical protein